jgi:hypothetical protein
MYNIIIIIKISCTRSIRPQERDDNDDDYDYENDCALWLPYTSLLFVAVVIIIATEKQG